MIARQWHGAVPKKHAAGFYQHLLATGVEHSRSVPGNVGAQVLRREEGERIHFTLITFWTSLDAIKCFAGENHESAVLYPGDSIYELVPDPMVVHFDVPYSSGSFASCPIS
jgi:heme-degrading monooxygenase HmoA